MRKLLLATAAVALIGTTAANATPADTLASILASSYYSGATITSSHSSIFGISVEATLADGTVVDNHYRLDGTLRKSETTSTTGVSTETTYDASGNVVKTETSADSNNDQSGSTEMSGSEDSSGEHSGTSASSEDSSSDHSGSDSSSSDSSSDSGSDGGHD